MKADAFLHRASRSSFPIAAVALTLFLHGLTAQATDDPDILWVRHSATIFGNMGSCAITLSFDSQNQIVENLNLKLTARDSNGRVRARGDMAVPDFGQSEAQRYADGHWSHPNLCEDKLSLSIEKAQAKISGKTFDLLAKALLEVEDFKPMPIRLAKKSPGKN